MCVHSDNYLELSSAMPLVHNVCSLSMPPSIALPSPEMLDDESNFMSMNMINTVEEGEEREDNEEEDTVCGDDVKFHGENYEMPDSS